MARWVTPCDPECPGYIAEVVEPVDRLDADPMSAGAPIDEFAAEWRGRHFRKCTRCQEYGAANIDVEY